MLLLRILLIMNSYSAYSTGRLIALIFVVVAFYVGMASSFNGDGAMDMAPAEDVLGVVGDGFDDGMAPNTHMNDAGLTREELAFFNTPSPSLGITSRGAVRHSANSFDSIESMSKRKVN